MGEERERPPGLVQRVERELEEYVVTSLFLAVFLGAMVNYRRVLMAEEGIPSLRYGYALIEALILGKIILIGDAVRVGKRLENGPLVVAALWKSVAFGLLVLAFTVLEHAVRALLSGESVLAALARRLAQPDEMIAQALLVLVAFIPFFALREAGRRAGETRLSRLMVWRPPPSEVGSGA